MKAIVYRRNGPPEVLEVVEMERPAPADDEVLLAVRAASVNPYDLHLMHGMPLLARGLFRIAQPTPARPGRPGRDVAGVVEAVGTKVTRFQPGDAVLGSCRGALAEYACAAESALVAKPAGVSFEQAAAVPMAGLTALQGLRDKGRIAPGQRVLIHGASGGVGTFAVQIARALGAEPTAVCSTPHVEAVRALGAARVIDYTREDFTRGAERYDLIFDLVADRSLASCRRVLAAGGVCVMAGARKPRRMLPRAIAAPVLSRTTGQTFVVLMTRLRVDDLAVLCGLMTAGKVTPLLDRVYGLEQVRDAMRHLEEGHAQGKIVVRL